jgi:hypothetical protein
MNSHAQAVFGLGQPVIVANPLKAEKEMASENG